MDPSKGKGLILLRYCNELLRRLSKTRHTVFSGRILLFLTGVYPLTERSGVNLKGEFNLDNSTTVAPSDLINHDDSTEIMDVDNESTLNSNHPKNLAFFKTFWSLQPYFNDPTIVLKSKNEWTRMESAIESVLQVFESENENDAKLMSSADKKRKSQSADSNSTSSGGGGNSNNNNGEKELLDLKDQYFFPKFLTSRNLFELQIKDVSFRRQIMVQMLIIFQFFMGLVNKQQLGVSDGSIPNSAAPPPAATAGPANKALSFLAYVLSEAQESWVNQIRTRVVRALEQTGPNGRRFLTTLTTVITHEANWIKWKADSCPGFEKRLSEKLEIRKRFLEQSLARNKEFMGSAELNILKMAESDPKILLKDSRRSTVKSLEEFLQPLADQLNDDGTVAEGVEAEYLHSKNRTFNWKAYRTALTANFHFFKDIDNIDTQTMVKRMKTGVGSAVPSQQQQQQQQQQQLLRQQQQQQQQQSVVESDSKEVDPMKGVTVLIIIYFIDESLARSRSRILLKISSSSLPKFAKEVVVDGGGGRAKLKENPLVTSPPRRSAVNDADDPSASCSEEFSCFRSGRGVVQEIV
ncbi:hypothetical protein HK100_009243 [Physocladia obscura]|uniref:Uncharacterized protein n=1 Tax=Physocladia obscura TaxID=109957 RepID=A0AAD5SNQ8_9FUNG|nr:hypothetical protein HK100_009243 [Physocladia obscura]